MPSNEHKRLQNIDFKKYLESVGLEGNADDLLEGQKNEIRNARAVLNEAEEANTAFTKISILQELAKFCRLL